MDAGVYNDDADNESMIKMVPRIIDEIQDVYYRFNGT